MPRTILLVDDEMTNLEVLSNMLDKDYTILTAMSGAEAFSVLRRKHAVISAVLLDLRMPEMDGFAVLAAIRENLFYRSIPVIVVTALSDLEAEEKAVSLGAYGFISKPFKSALIKHHLKNAISLKESAMLHNLVRRDSLTNIMNLRGFTDQADVLIRNQDSGYYVISSLDIDSFKIVNDQYGTQKGDRLLRYVAKTLSDFVAELGGICCRVAIDNFAVLYPAVYLGTDVIRNCHKALTSPDCINRTISFHIGRYLINDTFLPVSSMYDRAVLAKESVKGRYDIYEATYDVTMREKLLREQRIVGEMESALSSRQFEVWYQPIYDHSTGALLSSEALVRWRHPEMGLISPIDFIPVFERNGFIYTLDKFVWKQVCLTLRKWIDKGLNPLPVSVNVSRHDLVASDIVETLVNILTEFSIPFSLFRLEITETAFSKYPELVSSTVGRLVQAGFTVEIDDFGNGYSSLNILKDVPAQIIKIDMKFLGNGDKPSVRGGHIVESVVRMANWLGMSVIAEGVETREVADFLSSVGCTYIQGFLYAEPMPVWEYESFFTDEGHKVDLNKRNRSKSPSVLDDNSLWNPESIDSIIFKSYVGGACIFEYHDGKIKLLRASEKFVDMLGGAGMTASNLLKLDLSKHITPESAEKVKSDLDISSSADSADREAVGEYTFIGLPGCPGESCFRFSLRVIATAGDSKLVYATGENLTSLKQAKKKERSLMNQLRWVVDNISDGICALTCPSYAKGGSINDIGLLFANDRLCSLLGYTKEEFDNEFVNVFDMLHPDDIGGVKENIANIGRATFDCRCVKRGGEIISVSCTSCTTTIEESGDVMILLIITDKQINNG